MIEMKVAIRGGLVESPSSEPPDDLRFKVWWIPQLGMEGPNFEVLCGSVAEAVQLTDVLAYYDLFQLEHRIKPDFCNMGGVQEWRSWSDSGVWEWIDLDDDEVEEARGW